MRVSEKTSYTYFWETEYKFGKFLEKCFGDTFKRKYSLEGNGIFNLLYIDNHIYEIKYKQAKTLAATDNKSISDKNKKFIIDTITTNLKEGTEYSVVGGKFIYFPVAQFIGQIEIIKKLKEPK